MNEAERIGHSTFAVGCAAAHMQIREERLVIVSPVLTTHRALGSRRMTTEDAIVVKAL